jgi:hypothetical protein
MPAAQMIRQSTSRPSPLQCSATIEANVDTDIVNLFDVVTAEDVLPKVLKRFGFVPPVISTSGNTGPWDKPGSSRTVHLAGDTSAREEVTAFERPRYFAYRVDNFTFAVRHLAKFATGEWWFERDGAGSHLRWTYTFHAKGRLTAALLTFFVRMQWQGYMRGCILNTGRIVTQYLAEVRPVR